MKLLFLTSNSFLPSLRGGSELSMDNLAHNCIRVGHEPIVLSSFSKTKSWFELKSRACAKFSPNGFALDHVCGYPVYRVWNPVATVDYIVQHNKPDVAVIHAGGQKNLLAHAALAAHVPTVYYLRDISFTFHEEDRPVLEQAQFIANSNFTANIFRERTGRECAIIPPLVEPDNYRNNAPGNSVLFVNPHPWKGLDVVLTLAEQCPDIPFVFVENWEVSEEEKRASIQRKAKLRNVEWLKPTGDMKSLYARAKIVLAPSGAPYMGKPVNFVEAWGRIATEAHFSGIPVIASNQGGLPESVGPGGTLIDTDAEISVWKAALRSLWDDPQRYLEVSLQALKYSQRPEISPQKLFDEFISICQLAINKQSSKVERTLRT